MSGNDEWEEVVDPNTRKTFYVNHWTQETRWHKPNALVPLPSGWEEARDAEGRIYYIDHATRSTSWTDPRRRSNSGGGAASSSSSSSSSPRPPPPSSSSSSRHRSRGNSATIEGADSPPNISTSNAGLSSSLSSSSSSSSSPRAPTVERKNSLSRLPSIINQNLPSLNSLRGGIEGGAGSLGLGSMSSGLAAPPANLAEFQVCYLFILFIYFIYYFIYYFILFYFILCTVSFHMLRSLFSLLLFPPQYAHA